MAKNKTLTPGQLKANKKNGKKGGRPKGTISRRTYQKIIEAEEMRKAIKPNVLKIVNALTSVSLGQQFIYKLVENRNDKGTVISRDRVLVTDPHEIEEAFKLIDAGGVSEDGDTFYYITVKEPDVRGAKELFDRAYGKAKEHIEIDTPKDGILTQLYLLAREKRKGNQ